MNIVAIVFLIWVTAQGEFLNCIDPIIEKIPEIVLERNRAYELDLCDGRVENEEWGERDVEIAGRVIRVNTQISLVQQPNCEFEKEVLVSGNDLSVLVSSAQAQELIMGKGSLNFKDLNVVAFQSMSFWFMKVTLAKLFSFSNANSLIFFELSFFGKDYDNPKSERRCLEIESVKRVDMVSNSQDNFILFQESIDIQEFNLINPSLVMINPKHTGPILALLNIAQLTILDLVAEQCTITDELVYTRASRVRISNALITRNKIQGDDLMFLNHVIEIEIGQIVVQSNSFESKSFFYKIISYLGSPTFSKKHVFILLKDFQFKANKIQSNGGLFVDSKQNTHHSIQFEVVNLLIQETRIITDASSQFSLKEFFFVLVGSKAIIPQVKVRNMNLVDNEGTFYVSVSQFIGLPTRLILLENIYYGSSRKLGKLESYNTKLTGLLQTEMKIDYVVLRNIAFTNIYVDIELFKLEMKNTKIQISNFSIIDSVCEKPIFHLQNYHLLILDGIFLTNIVGQNRIFLINSTKTNSIAKVKNIEFINTTNYYSLPSLYITSYRFILSSSKILHFNTYHLPLNENLIYGGLINLQYVRYFQLDSVQMVNLKSTRGTVFMVDLLLQSQTLVHITLLLHNCTFLNVYSQLHKQREYESFSSGAFALFYLNSIKLQVLFIRCRFSYLFSQGSGALLQLNIENTHFHIIFRDSLLQNIRAIGQGQIINVEAIQNHKHSNNTVNISNCNIKNSHSFPSFDPFFIQVSSLIAGNFFNLEFHSIYILLLSHSKLVQFQNVSVIIDQLYILIPKNYLLPIQQIQILGGRVFEINILRYFLLTPRRIQKIELEKKFEEKLLYKIEEVEWIRIQKLLLSGVACVECNSILELKGTEISILDSLFSVEMQGSNIYIMVIQESGWVEMKQLILYNQSSILIRDVKVLSIYNLIMVKSQIADSSLFHLLRVDSSVFNRTLFDQISGMVFEIEKSNVDYNYQVMKSIYTDILFRFIDSKLNFTNAKYSRFSGQLISIYCLLRYHSTLIKKFQNEFFNISHTELSVYHSNFAQQSQGDFILGTNSTIALIRVNCQKLKSNFIIGDTLKLKMVFVTQKYSGVITLTDSYFKIQYYVALHSQNGTFISLRQALNDEVLLLSNSQFYDANSSESGGALQFQMQHHAPGVMIKKSMFKDIQSNKEGGAISYKQISGRGIKIHNLAFINTKARVANALYYNSSIFFYVEIQSSLYLDENRKRVHLEQHIQGLPGLVGININDKLINISSNEVVKLNQNLTPDGVNIRLNVSLYDFHFNILASLELSSLMEIVFDDQNSTYSVLPTGMDYSSNQLACFLYETQTIRKYQETKNYSLKFRGSGLITTPLQPNLNKSFFSRDLTFLLTDCEIGLFWDENQGLCQQCPADTFTRFKNQMNCEPCLTGMICEWGIYSTLLNGYWRNEKYDGMVYECVNRMGSCNGDAEKGFCSEGYVGPLCESCDYIGMVWPSNFVKTNHFECGNCTMLSRAIIVFQVLIGILAILFIAFQFINSQLSSLKMLTFKYIKRFGFLYLSKTQFDSQALSVYLLQLVNYFYLLDFMKYVTKVEADFLRVSTEPNIQIGKYFPCEINRAFQNKMPSIHSNFLLDQLPSPCLTFFLSIAIILVASKKLFKYSLKTQFLRGLLFFGFSIQPQLLQNILQYTTFRSIDDRKYIRQDIQFQYFSQIHVIIFSALAVPSFIFWILAPILVIVMIRKQKKKNMDSVSFILKYGFYFNLFNQQSYYYRALLIYRLLSFQLSFSLFNQKEAGPFLICVIINFVLLNYLINDNNYNLKFYQSFENYMNLSIIFSYTLCALIIVQISEKTILVLKLIIYLLNGLIITEYIYKILHRFVAPKLMANLDNGQYKWYYKFILLDSFYNIIILRNRKPVRRLLVLKLWMNAIKLVIIQVNQSQQNIIKKKQQQNKFSSKQIFKVFNYQSMSYVDYSFRNFNYISVQQHQDQDLKREDDYLII